MKRLLLSLICCFPLLFVSSISLSLELTGPSGQIALNDEAEQYGPISRTETLWAISSKLRPDNSVSVHQTMVALYKLNPDAFDNGNINKIIANSTLLIPSFEFISEQTNTEASRLISKYTNKKVVVKKEIPKVITPPAEEVKEPIKEEVTVKEQELPKVEVNTVDKEQLLASEEKLAILQTEMQLLNEQFIVATEATQVLKLKLQPLTDEISILSEQLEEEAVINEKLQDLIDEYRIKLDAVELPPYSGEGLLNEILRLITSSLTNLLIVILTPVLLLALVFVIISRIGTKRLLAEQDQELAESTATLMEEPGQFDQLFTDDISDEELEGAEDLDTEDEISLEEINLDEDEADENVTDLDVVDLTEEDDEELITNDDDPFGINALVEDEELISSVDLDDLDLDIESTDAEDALSSINIDDDEFEDPFGTDELSESEDKENSIDLDESAKFDLDEAKEISAAEQADLDLAAEWEAQLSAESDNGSEQTDDSDENELEVEEDSEERTSETLTDDELLDLDNLDESDHIETLDALDLGDLESQQESDDIDSDLFDNLDLNLDELETEADVDKVETETELDVDEVETEADVEAEAEADVDEVETETELDVDEVETEAELDVDEVETETELDVDEFETEAELDVDEVEVEIEQDVDEVESEDDAELEEEDKKNTSHDNLAQQLSDVAFNEEVPLPKVDKASKDDFIDIETLLENSGVNDDEPYSELDLDLGLDDFPDVVDLKESIDIDDDENGIGAQLDLARAYLEIDDQAGAKEILMAVVGDSNGAQRVEIDKLLSRLR